MPFSQPTSGFKVPGPYDSELAAIARREKMAQIMQQQALQPLEINSFQGFQAPISPLQGIAKVLQMYAGMTASDKGDDARAELGRKIRTEGLEQLASLEGTPAQPAIAPTPGTSFAPTALDFEDNPNLQVAPSGNVEMPGTPGRAAIPAMPLEESEKKRRLVDILSRGNPYSAPVAKLLFEDMQKAPSLIKEYEYARDKQGFKGTLQDFRASMRPVTNVNMPSSMQPMWVRNKTTGNMEWIQPNNRGTFDLSNYEQAGTTDVEKLIEARNRLPEGSPDRIVIDSMIKKLGTSGYGANTTVVKPGQEAPDITLPPPQPGMVNAYVDGQPVALPIKDADAINAQFKGAEASAVEGAKATYDFVTVPDPKIPGNKILVPKSAVAKQAAGGSPVVAEFDKKAQQGTALLELAEEGKRLLPAASSGALSTLATLATDALGVATDKAAADASLKVIAAGLTSNVPRFEGPQGVLDVKLYQEAAADIGNSLKPYKNRIEALNTVIRLNRKYASPETVGAPPPGSVRRITPQGGK